MSDLFLIVVILLAVGLGYWLRGTSLNLSPEMRKLLEGWIARSKEAEAEKRLRELMASGSGQPTQPATPPPQPAPQPAPVTPANPTTPTP